MNNIISFFLIVNFLSLNCKTNNKIPPSESINQLSVFIENNIYKLELDTKYIMDTLNVIDWEEDNYSSPIIVKQELKFYKNTILIRSYFMPIKSVHKETIRNNRVAVSEIPITEICINVAQSDFYVVGGSDFCNGVFCPEYTGIYSMNGDVIFEGINTEMKESDKIRLKRILEENKININKNKICKSLIKDYKFWDRN